jgi:hypothetical protein
MTHRANGWAGICVAAATLLCAIAVVPASAQQSAPPELRTDVPPSRWQAQVDSLDEAFRSRMLTANEPRANWIAGLLDQGDIESQVRHFAAARVAAPDNKLYLATLATACMQPVRPPLPECAAVDRLADWATRDRDNGWPSLLLADRSRQHGNAESMLAYLQQAAAQPRFVEYWEAGSLEIWEAVRAMPVDAEQAAKLELAVMYAMARSLAWPNAARATCMGSAERTLAARAACADLGAAMRERGSTWMSRLIGARMAVANAASPGSKSIAEAKLSTVRGQIAACSRSTGTILDGLEATDAATRAKSVAEWDAWLRREAAVGEARACEERVAATSPAPSKAR